MTKPPFRIKPWPFSKDEVATLLWLSSPQMKGTQSQWRFSGLFRSDKDKKIIEEVEFDWAMLPLLRLGQPFKDGTPLEYKKNSVVQIDLSRASEPNLVDARSILSREIYRLYKPKFWQEYCWVWALPGQDANKVVLPVLVLLQGLFARGSAMTNGLVDQFFLDSFRHEREGDLLKLSFDASFELPKRKKERISLITLIARLLCDPSFGIAFRSVALRRTQSPTAPLSSELPELHTIWQARVLSRSNIRLVQELVRAEPRQSLPIQRVTYEHPLFPRRVVSPVGFNTTQRVNVPDGYTVDTEAPAASIPTTANKLPSPKEPLVERTHLTIRNVGPEKEGKVGASVKPGAGSEREVSFAETGQGATAPQAGVRPGHLNSEAEQSGESGTVNEEWARLRNDGLDEFRRMLVKLKVEHEVKIQFHIGPKTLRSNSDFIKIPRPYAAVSLESATFAPSWLIEFAGGYSRQLSTLVVAGCGTEWSKFEATLTTIMLNCLNPRYWWKLDGLEKVRTKTGLGIYRVPHITWEADGWATRIHEQLR